LPPRLRVKRPTIGYIASSNPWNVNSFRALHTALEARPNLTERFDFSLAGPICGAVQKENRIFKIKGMVNRVENFYQSVDIVVNPMLGGTGLKIKSIEALSYGRAFFSTVDGMVGIQSTHPQHNALSVEELVVHLDELGTNGIAPLAMASREVLSGYLYQQMMTFKNVVQSMQGSVVTTPLMRTFEAVPNG